MAWRLTPPPRPAWPSLSRAPRREQAINDAAAMMQMQQMQMGAANPMGWDPAKAFEGEKAALNLVSVCVCVGCWGWGARRTPLLRATPRAHLCTPSPPSATQPAGAPVEAGGQRGACGRAAACQAGAQHQQRQRCAADAQRLTRPGSSSSREAGSVTVSVCKQMGRCRLGAVRE